jgi:hypothetical protein
MEGKHLNARNLVHVRRVGIIWQVFRSSFTLEASDHSTHTADADLTVEIDGSRDLHEIAWSVSETDLICSCMLVDVLVLAWYEEANALFCLGEVEVGKLHLCIFVAEIGLRAELSLMAGGMGGVCIWSCQLGLATRTLIIPSSAPLLNRSSLESMRVERRSRVGWISSFTVIISLFCSGCSPS